MTRIMKPIILILLIFRMPHLEAVSFKDRNYFLKEGYISRAQYNHFDKNNLSIIGDVGCGSGFKLIKYLRFMGTIGGEKSLLLNCS